MTNNGREIAYTILFKVEKNKAYSNFSLSSELNNVSLIKKGFITELVYGVIERKITLDYYINKHSSVPVRKLDTEVLTILRMACYQLAYMRNAPPHAVCDESVKLAKVKAPRRSGFVNGVLRSMSNQELQVEKYNKKAFHSKTRYLSVLYSLPEWFVEEWVNKWGEGEAVNLFAALLEKPSFSIRYNKLKTSRDKLLNSLEVKGYQVTKSKLTEYGLIVQNPMGIFETEEFKDGLFYVQDEAAILVSEFVDPYSDNILLDCCSAPGGKTSHMAEIMQDRGKIIACDIYEHKLRLIQDNASRLGIRCIETMLLDATEYKKEFLSAFDKVLIDAPCSGTGLIKRKPEIKWNRSKEEVKDLVTLQKKILSNSSRYVKLHGELVYSTCSIEEMENQGVVSSFLKKNNNFELVDDMITLYPNVHGCDGFFMAKLKRVK